MADRGYTEQFVDYSAGREDAPTLTMMVGLSGSGKSVLTKGWVLNGYGRVLRFNRDDLRAMLYPGVTWENGGKRNEDLVRRYEQEGVKSALRAGHVTDVIVDDTNCVLRTRNGWEEIARDSRAKFRIVNMTTSLQECIERDAKRTGTACVGEKVVRGQYKTLCEATVTPKMYEVNPDVLNRAMADREDFRTGEFTRRLKDSPFILCDIDGTLADHTGVRSPFDESKVLLDGVHEVVANWVRALYPHYNIIIVSGRHAGCCPDTVDWLNGYKIPFDFIVMRSAGDNRSDAIIKPELLSEILTTVRKDEIAWVIDDRPRVIRAWKEVGLKVYPVAGTTEHAATCTFKGSKGYRRCPICSALEDF